MYPLSERLASLGIMGDQLRAFLKILLHDSAVMVRGVKAGLRGASMTPRDASIVVFYRSERSSNFGELLSGVLQYMEKHIACIGHLYRSNILLRNRSSK